MRPHIITSAWREIAPDNHECQTSLCWHAAVLLGQREPVQRVVVAIERYFRRQHPLQQEHTQLELCLSLPCVC